jgi:hypothetical protein
MVAPWSAITIARSMSCLSALATVPIICDQVPVDDARVIAKLAVGHLVRLNDASVLLIDQRRGSSHPECVGKARGVTYPEDVRGQSY